MGMFFKAKCENCWDSIPCACPRQRERDDEARSYQVDETNRLLREQNQLIREQNALLKQKP